MSSKTKYWSSLVAVNWTSLNTSLSTIKSTFITFDLRNSQCSVSCEITSSLHKTDWVWLARWHRNSRNYCCLVQNSIGLHVTALVFDPFSADAGRAVHVSGSILSDIVSANYALFVVTNRKIGFSIHLNSSPVIQYGRIPILAEYWMKIESK